MNQLIKIRITEIFIKLESTNDSLVDYESLIKNVIPRINKPSQILNLKTITTYTEISSGTFFVPNDLHISKEGELKINPGVILYFASGKGIISYGKLTLAGEADNLIIITGNHWANISIFGESSKNSMIVNTIIEGGNSNIETPTYGETFKSWNNSSFGGNLYSENSHLIIKNCIIFNGHADNGGGIFIYNSFINFENVLVFNNSAVKRTGGIEIWSPKYNSGKPSRIKNSFIVKNKGFLVGGISIDNGTIILDNLEILFNISTGMCGGINISKIDRFELDDTRLINSKILKNFGSVCGGVMFSEYVPKGEDLITNLITGNTSDDGKNPNIYQSCRPNY
ncbi:MAG: hypothetical protein WAR79_00465 [Melioribacteraceae bacterium]